MNALTKIWKMPRSDAQRYLNKIYGVDVTKPVEERKTRYKVRVTYLATEDFDIEADSAKEAMALARQEISSDEVICEAKIIADRR